MKSIIQNFQVALWIVCLLLIILKLNKNTNAAPCNPQYYQRYMGGGHNMQNAFYQMAYVIKMYKTMNPGTSNGNVPSGSGNVPSGSGNVPSGSGNVPSGNGNNPNFPNYGSEQFPNARYTSNQKVQNKKTSKKRTG